MPYYKCVRATNVHKKKQKSLTSMNDNERWRILTMVKGACKNQNGMAQTEAVRFAEKKDGEWLSMQAAMTTVTKIHRTYSLRLLLLPFV